MLNLFEANVMTLERRGEQVFLLQKPHRFTGEAASRRHARGRAHVRPIRRGDRAHQSHSASDSAALIDVTNWFVSDLSGISQRVRSLLRRDRAQPPPVPFDRQRSYVENP